MLEHVLGVKREGDALRVQPCVPPSFRNFSVRYRQAGGELELSFEQLDSDQGLSIELDGQPVRGLVPLPRDGRSHRARVRFGARRPALREQHEAAEDPRRFKKLG